MVVGADYYGVLGVHREATNEQINKAYRRQALKYHPDRAQDNPEEAAQQFRAVAEAYDVLSDTERRAAYNLYGERGLKAGASGTGGYSFTRDPLEIFEKFFGTLNPYESMFTDSEAFTAGGLVRATGPKQSPPVRIPLSCTLEELYNGAIKKHTFTKLVLNEDGKTTHSEDQVLTIEVQPGWPAGTAITFPQHGDQGPSIIPADVICVIEEAKHDTYSRNGDDLTTTVTIPLVLALVGGKADVPTLDGRILHVPLNDVISPKQRIVVQGEGMPRTKDATQRGDLTVLFDIKFPRALTPAQKEQLLKLLPVS